MADMVPSIIFGCVIDIVSDDNTPWLITEGCTLTGFECHSHRRQLMMAMFIFAAVGLTSSFATFGASSLKRIAAARLLQDLRIKLFSAIAAQGCTFFDQSSTGRPRAAPTPAHCLPRLLIHCLLSPPLQQQLTVRAVRAGELGNRLSSDCTTVGDLITNELTNR